MSIYEYHGTLFIIIITTTYLRFALIYPQKITEDSAL